MKGIGALGANQAMNDWDGQSPWLGSDGFLFDPIRGITYSTNDVGSFIYQRLRLGLGIDDIVASLSGRFEVDPQTARIDVEDFVAQVRAAGLS